MPLVLIDLQEPIAVPAIKRGPPVRFALTSTNVSRGSFPGRGLLRSILIHEIALYGLIFLSPRHGVTTSPRSETFQMIDLRGANQVIYLPPLEPAREGSAPRQEGSRLKKWTRHRGSLRPRETARRDGHAAPPQPGGGLIYPGPQPLISDVPEPTNTVQTILQPELKNPPILKPLVPTPNIVLLAHAEPVPLADPLKSRLERPAQLVVPKIQLEPTKPVEAPQLALPKNVPQIPPSSALPPRPKLPERVVVPKVQLEPAKPVEAPQLAFPKNVPQIPPSSALPPRPKLPERVVVPKVQLEPAKPVEAPQLAFPKNVPPISASLMLPSRPKLPDRPVVPKVQLEPAKPLQAPALALPTSTPQNFPAQPATRPPEPVAQAAGQPGEKTAQNSQGAPNSEHGSLPGTTGNDLHTLLALSPMPATDGQSVKIPAGEARGRFAISPESKPAGVRGGLGTTPGDHSSRAAGALVEGGGSTSNGPSAGTGGVGKGAEARSEGTASGGVGATKGTNAGDGVRAFGGGPASGSSSRSGLRIQTSASDSAGALGLGRGPGSGLRSESGSGARSGAGNGAGASSGSGGGAFAGITIQGGSLTGKATTRPLARAATPPATPPPPRPSYGLTIVSTSNSGGGLADFGVFRNEQVYTVYLDMRRTVEDPAPSWTLQYAVLREAAIDGNPANPPERTQEGLVPPIPLSKEQPQWPDELIQKYQHRQIVVSAIINKEGKFEQVLVKQSPNAQLNGPLLEALDKWVFRAAELNGQTVSVKVLLGIPVSLPQ